ncbi:MAG: DNA-deoxyinosine glycosylase [Zetaproteobacteria bacterium]|nr:MAG: DNA-deoxyinosine glycosylase [Zetaproteobacteria bacterium]
MTETGFPYSAAKHARILILGSMPGRLSLARRQYYAHPKNAFWPIMSRLLGIPAEASYETRLENLRKAGIALWDVAHQCARKGSMDHNIRLDSVIANDFASFFRSHPQIGHLFFNGRKAAELYRRLVLPGLPPALQHIPATVLPSTSPAHARLNLEQKILAWSVILKPLETAHGRPYEAPASQIQPSS